MGIQAYSIGIPLQRRLRPGDTSRVLARYDGTLLLEMEVGQLWAITRYANPGAFRIVAASLPLWDPGELISIRKCELRARGIALSCNGASEWNPRPAPWSLTASERLFAIQRIARELERWAIPDTHGFWDRLASGWHSLHAALERRDSLALTALLTPLIGCGPGLTPAGDDFVAALLVTLSAGDGSHRLAFHALARAVGPLLTQTTRVSQSFLQEARRGWSFGSLKTLIEALPNASTEATRALLQVGASSGPAFALGVLMGLEELPRHAGGHRLTA